MALSENINALEKAKFVEFSGETAVRVYVVNPSGGGSSVKNFGIESILNGQDYATIVFDTAMTDTNYSSIINIECDDSNPIFLNYIVTNKSTLGMTVKLNAPVDSDNYSVSYAVME